MTHFGQNRYINVIFLVHHTKRHMVLVLICGEIPGDYKYPVPLKFAPSGF